jgi:hypothetical protein
MTGTMRTVVVVGWSGQLASDLRRLWPEQHPADRLVGLLHADLEVREIGSVRRA